MTTEHKFTHKCTRPSSEARKKLCQGCRESRGTLLSYYEVDDKPKVFAFCTSECEKSFRRENKNKNRKSL